MVEKVLRVAADVQRSPPEAKSNTEGRAKVRQHSSLIRWLDRHTEKMDKYWARLPNFVGSFAATCAIFLLGACFRGEWLLIAVHFAKRFGYVDRPGPAVDQSRENASLPPAGPETWGHALEESQFLRYFGMAWIFAVCVSYTVYFSVSGFLHWYYYVRQRDNAEEWKCQPYKWLSPTLEKHEIILGVSSLFCTNTLTAAFAAYIINGGPSMVYYDIEDYTWYWWFLQWPVLYLILDYETYWFHRLYHRPTMYKLFHKLHHTYKQPTAWSATAIHPVEIMHMQLCYLLVLFVVPSHLIPYCTIMLYNFYHGILDHSGINFKAQWWQPWQPDASFHDNHHQYTHVNFGFNMFYWDKLHGTYRLKDRIYNENIFFGRGKKISEATEEELNADIQERDSENLDNKVIYCIEKDKVLKEGKVE